MGKYVKLWFLEHRKWANYQGSGSVLGPGSPRSPRHFCAVEQPGPAHALRPQQGQPAPSGSFFATGRLWVPAVATELHRLMESGPRAPHLEKPCICFHVLPLLS